MTVWPDDALHGARSDHFDLDLHSVLYSVLAAAVTAVLFASVSTALRPIGMPALTAPFVLVTWAFLFAAPAFRTLTVR